MRPTAEPVRAALLDQLGETVVGAKVLDLFAGTGALGLEAISRGARSCDFVEFRPASLHALRTNIARLKLRERTRTFKKDAVLFAASLPAGSYDLAFADPPYESKVLDRVVTDWLKNRFSSWLAVEHARSHKLPRGHFHQKFGDTAITIFRRPDHE